MIVAEILLFYVVRFLLEIAYLRGYIYIRRACAESGVNLFLG